MKNKDPQIEFYKGAVHTILERYTFTKDEKQVIQAAILTAKKDKPNMKLIKEADALLNKVTSSRPAKANNEAKINKYGNDDHAWIYKEKSFMKKPFGITGRILSALVILAFTIAALKYATPIDLSPQASMTTQKISTHSDFYTFSEAEKLCHSEGLVLPKVAQQSLDIPAEWQDEGYWGQDTKVFYDVLRGYFGAGDDVKKHHAVCVSVGTAS